MTGDGTMPLTGEQVGRLQAAILSAFSLADLDQLIRIDLNENREAISTGDSLSDVVFALIVWAEKHSRTQGSSSGPFSLLEPGNEAVRSLAAMFAPADDASTDSMDAAAPSRRLAKIWLYSTPESVEAGDVSLLAITETVVATLIVVYFALWRNSLFLIALTTLAAPSLLLRTKESQKMGLELFQKLFKCFSPGLNSRFDIVTYHYIYNDSTNIFCVLLIFLLTAIFSFLAFAASVVAKVIATAACLFRNPLGTLLAIPKNCRRICFSLDLAHAPEIVPGIEIADISELKIFGRSADKYLKINVMTTTFRPSMQKGVWLSVYYITVSITLLSTVYLPSILYRISLKSTSLAYLPLIWSIRRNLSPGDGVKAKVGDVIEDGMERLSRWYALIVIGFFTTIPGALLLLSDSMRAQLSGTVAPFISSAISPVLGYQLLKIVSFVTPDGVEIGSWHLTRLAGAFVTIWLYNYARKIRRRIDNGIPLSADVERRIGVAAFIRSLLGIWTSVCSVGIILTAVRWYELPAVVIRWFPWMAAQ